MIKIDLHPNAAVVRQFAWIAVPGMAVLGFVALKLSVGFAWDHPVFLGCLALGIAQLALHGLGAPQLSRWLFVALTLLFAPVGIVVSNVLVGVIYFFVITPFGLAFRLVGRDVLGRRPDPSAASYWHVRPGARKAGSYFKLY